MWPRRAETLKQPKNFSGREIDVNAKELSSHQTALALAAKNGREEIVRLLL